MMAPRYFVYILSNFHNTVVYTGITNDLVRRVFEHKSDGIECFTKKYRVHKLVFYEIHEDAMLISALNPSWEELYDKL